MSKGPRVPDYMAPIAGARSWRLAPTLWAEMGGLLWSRAMLNVWPDGEEKVAECETNHAPPGDNCSCGLYALYDPDLMHERGYGPDDGSIISGVVAGRGDFIRHDCGYWVAERAMVLAFFEDPYPTPVEYAPYTDHQLPTKESAATAYGVPVIRFDEYEDFCDEYGLIRFGRSQKGR